MSFEIKLPGTSIKFRIGLAAFALLAPRVTPTDPISPFCSHRPDRYDSNLLNRLWHSFASWVSADCSLQHTRAFRGNVELASDGKHPTGWRAREVSRVIAAF